VKREDEDEEETTADYETVASENYLTKCSQCHLIITTDMPLYFKDCGHAVHEDCQERVRNAVCAVCGEFTRRTWKCYL